MQAVEIKLNLSLNEKELALVELHSIYNILTIVSGELQFMQTVLGDKTALREGLGFCGEFTRAFVNMELVRPYLANWDAHRSALLGEIAEAMASHPVKPEHRSLLDASRANLERVLDVLDIRVVELLERLDAPDRWRTYPTDEVIRRLTQVLNAIAGNSRGRFGIVYDPLLQKPNDYLVIMNIKGYRAGQILVPPILLDSLRDLTANARKYTQPGGLVECSLLEDDDSLTLEVSDTGRGIPENEIAGVVGFGVRGSNTNPSETKGGGFGLTKAAYVCQKLGGRMWIASEPGRGTRITMHIPKPAVRG